MADTMSATAGSVVETMGMTADAKDATPSATPPTISPMDGSSWATTSPTVVTSSCRGGPTLADSPAAPSTIWSHTSEMAGATSAANARIPSVSSLPKTAFMPFRTSLRAPEIRSCPNASMTPATPLVTAFSMFANAVPIPPCASSASSEKRSLSSANFSTNSPMESEPHSNGPPYSSSLPPPSTAYRSSTDAPAPSTDSASWFIWPGAAESSERQSCMSGLPLATIWRNCSMAALTMPVDCPPASSIELSASPASVTVSMLVPYLSVAAKRPDTVDAMSSSLVGTSESASLIVWMDACASSDSTPSDSMMRG